MKKIFDQNGNELQIADVISDFIMDKVKEYKADDIMLRSYEKGSVIIDEIVSFYPVEINDLEELNSSN